MRHIPRRRSQRRLVIGWRGVGIWIGLAAGLAFVAVVLVIRFAMRERLGLLRPR